MAFIPSRIKKHNTDPGRASLQLTSMMDMFTIILVFLLKSFSVEGSMIQPSEHLTLPFSSTQKPPEVGLDVTVDQKWILVNNQPVEAVSNVDKVNGLIIPRLYDRLLIYAREAQRMERQYGVKFTGKATIQGDKNLPYRILVKVMATCGRAQYPNMRLVTYRREG